MNAFRFLGAVLTLLAAIAGMAKAAPFESPTLYRKDVVVTLSGKLDLHGETVVLVLDHPIALQGADGRPADAMGRSKIGVIGFATITDEFRPRHVTITGTLGVGFQGQPIAVTMQSMRYD